MSKFGPPTVYFIFGVAKKADQGDKTFWYFFVAEMITTCFCIYWDFRWDWGFFTGTKKDNWYLRDQMMYPKYFYFTCVIFNLIFRFWWLIGCFTFEEAALVDSVGLIAFSAMFVEAIRRTFWAMIRVENEFFNNFEQYRDVMMIPPIKDDSIPSAGADKS